MNAINPKIRRPELFCRDTPSGRAYHAQRVADGEKATWGETWNWAQWWAGQEIERRFGKGIIAADGHTWEADHIVPVVEGGGLCGLENYRTLCLSCHRRETAELAKRRAVARRVEKARASPQIQLVAV